ncbi:MAG: MarR family EPS-associated transcriptional regulator [Acidithiobacillus sp.]
MLFDDSTHYKLLKLIAEHPEYTQRDIALAMGVSVGKTNFCVKALIDKGTVKMGNFRQNPQKRVYTYMLTAQGIEEKARVTVKFLQRKMAEYDSLRAEIAALHLEVNEIVAPNLGAGRGAA